MSAVGERIRMDEQVVRLIALVEAFRLTKNMAVPCSEAALAVADAALRLVATAARHDAYQRTEKP